MYTIMGITGQVGGATARTLLQAGKHVRGVARDEARAALWKAAGVELATVPDANDATALEAAFRDTEGVFVMIPPNFAPAPGFPETRGIVAALRQALIATRPPKVVYLSSIGAQCASGLGVIAQLHILETELGTLPIPQAFIRAGWFLENFQWDVASARDQGIISAFLHPLDRAFPMIATEDIGALAAKTLQESWTGNRFLELEGPRRYSMQDAAMTFSTQLGKPVHAQAIPPEEWATLFERQGMPAERTGGRIEMLDGFNSGWIEFEGGDRTEHCEAAPRWKLSSKACSIRELSAPSRRLPLDASTVDEAGIRESQEGAFFCTTYSRIVVCINNHYCKLFQVNCVVRLPG